MEAEKLNEIPYIDVGRKIEPFPFISKGYGELLDSNVTIPFCTTNVWSPAGIRFKVVKSDMFQYLIKEFFCRTVLRTYVYTANGIDSSVLSSKNQVIMVSVVEKLETIMFIGITSSIIKAAGPKRPSIDVGWMSDRTKVTLENWLKSGIRPIV